MSDEAIDRTVLPIRRPPFGGVANRTLELALFLAVGWRQAAHHC